MPIAHKAMVAAFKSRGSLLLKMLMISGAADLPAGPSVCRTWHAVQRRSVVFSNSGKKEKCLAALGHFPFTHKRKRVVGVSFSLKTWRREGTAFVPRARIFSSSGCDQRSERLMAESVSKAGCMTLTTLC